jgi:hypothetical protein
MSGKITASGFRVEGGINTEFLMADGSVSTINTSTSNHNDLTELNEGDYLHLTEEEKNNLESIENKSSSFTVSSTTTYPNTKALVDGLATKQPTISGLTNNFLPKSNGSGGFVDSQVSDNAINVKIGNRALDFDYGALVVAKDYNLSGSVSGNHGFRDESYVTLSAGSTGLRSYAGYDFITTLSGLGDYGHLHGYQARPQFTGGGYIEAVRSHTSQLTHTGTGVINENTGYYVADYLGTGTVNTNVGLYIGDLQKGISRFGIYSPGNVSSYHQGLWQTGGNIQAGAYLLGSNLKQDIGSNNLSIGALANASINNGYALNVGHNAGGNQNIGRWFTTAIGANSGLNATDNSTYLGAFAGALATGSGLVCLGKQAGYYESENNKLFIDNTNRANEVDAREKSLIYGKFDALPNNQFLTVNGKLNIGVVPTTSADSYDILTRNSITGEVESVASNFYVDNSTLETYYSTIDSPTFIGAPLAPTATVGTNTTQIATTAFVLENALSIPFLKYNDTDKTVWNNGKGDVAGNTVFGEISGISNTSGTNNTSIGYGASYSNTDGGANTSVGTSSLFGNASGVSNTSIGFAAGNYYNVNSILTNPSHSTFIGASTKALADNGTNETVIGNEALGNGSNTVTLGNDFVIKTYLKGKIITNGTIRLKSYTVATLPTGTEGDTAYVTDATAPTYLGTLTGGGTIKTPVFYNGTNWVS